MADDILVSAKEQYDIAKLGWNDVYESLRDDLEFLSDEPYAQWDKKLLDDRKNRPIYQIDQLSQFIHQVANDIRINTPSIDIIPDDEATDMESAEILQGIIRGIEYKSNADAAYDNAVDFAIRCSLGWLRVENVYSKDKGFEQELRIKRVVNPASIYIDPNSIEFDGSDAMYGFASEEVSKKEFERRYPNANPVSFGEVDFKQDGKTVTIAEYFRIVEETEDLGLTDKGEIQKVDENGVYKTKRKVSKRKVERYLLSGQDVLESTTFPGKYIPLVPVYGEEAWRDGKRYLMSLIRKAKSSQQMFNLGVSLDVEMLMKQPQASFMAGAGQISGFEHEYSDPTKANVLHYNVEDVNGNKLPPPQRVNPPQSPIGFINMSREAVDNIKSTLGMYNASVGQRSNETSGKAINARKLEADVANYHFGDNLTRSITHVGQILICAFPDIYDTPRAVKMVDKEENAKMIGINGYRVEGQERDFDFTQGQYDVRVTTGASFTTQRQEAAATYSQLIQAMPDLMPVIGDLVFKYQDSAGSQAISARLKKIVDPKLLSDEEREENEPDPQVAALTQQLQAIQQEAQATIAQLQAELQSKQSEQQLKAGELQVKNKEVEIKAFEAQQKAMQAQQVEAPVDNTVDTAIKLKELEIKEFEAKSRAENDRAKLLLEAEKIKLDSLKMLSDNSQDNDVESGEEMEDEQQQKEAQMMMLQGIIQSVQGLTAAIQNPPPMQVLRDEQGNIIGAA
jgi:hypothetical protein